MDNSASPVFRHTVSVISEWKLYIQQNSSFLLFAGAIVLLYVILSLWPPAVKVPVVTAPSHFLLRVFSKWGFIFNAPTAVSRGYEKYKNSAFQVPRANGNMVVLPARYSDELRNLPSSKLNSIEAAIGNRVGNLTDILIDSPLTTDVIQKRLTPAIGRMVPRLLDELEYSFEKEIPKCEDSWAPSLIEPLMGRIVTRITSRLFVGEDVCRNELWILAVTTYAKEVFTTSLIMRLLYVPSFLRPALSPFFPSFWRAKRQLKIARDILVPIIERRRTAEQSGDPLYQKPDDFLQGMMDLATNETEAEPANLTQRLLAFMSMPAVATPTTSLGHVIYDLIDMPDYIDALRQEMKELLPQNFRDITFGHLRELKRLDSFLRESQRFHPNFTVTFSRIVKEPMTLSDGLYLPKGTYISMPATPISMDNTLIPNAHQFDGFRWFKEGLSSSSFPSTGPTHLHWGLGKYACPGRWFAAVMMKALLVRLLQEYDFRFDEGQQGRPKDLLVEISMIPAPSAKIFFKKRDIKAF